MKGENAYFTVEAGLVLSIVFYTILFLLFTGFYQYNRCLLIQDTYRLALRGSQMLYADNEEVKARVKSEDAGWYYEKYAACIFKEKKIQVTKGKVIMVQKAEVKSPLFVFGERMNNGIWGMQTSAESVRISPVTVIRGCRKAEELVRGG